jgi:hypothetical protein
MSATSGFLLHGLGFDVPGAARIVLGASGHKRFEREIRNAIRSNSAGWCRLMPAKIGIKLSY